jgi:hypothetical protein
MLNEEKLFDFLEKWVKPEEDDVLNQFYTDLGKVFE